MDEILASHQFENSASFRFHSKKQQQQSLSSLSDLMVRLLSVVLAGAEFAEDAPVIEAWMTKQTGVDFLSLFRDYVRRPRCLPVTQILDAIGVKFTQVGQNVSYSILSNDKIPEKVRRMRMRIFENV
jgi:hypothetical protein